MKLSDRIREEISKSGIVRWDDLEAEVFKLEKEIDILERTTGTIETIQLKDTIYISSLSNVLDMCKANSLDIATTTFIIQLYNEHHIRIIDNEQQ
jgi:hypothetical protein